VASVRDIAVEWRLFSLALANAPDGDDPLTADGRGVAALRTLALVGRERGNEAVDRLYRALGERVHERHEELDEGCVRAALGDAGLDAGLLDHAVGDPVTVDEVRSQHLAAVEQIGAFGVPSIILPSGRGIFGPVVAVAPTGEAAGELWDRVRWLIEMDGFFELKRNRDRKAGASRPPDPT